MSSRATAAVVERARILLRGVALEMRVLRFLLLAVPIVASNACGAADDGDSNGLQALPNEPASTGEGNANDPPGTAPPGDADAAGGGAQEDADADAGPIANEPDIDTIAWETGAAIGNGVAHKSTQNPRGNNAAIVYAGFGVSLNATRGWATALYRAQLRDRGVRELWAVQGPNLVEYQNREIGNSKIAASLVAKVSASTKFVLVLGHSSGSFVAHELLGQLDGGLDPSNVTDGKVVYFDLDGGQSGLSGPIVARLRKAYFVGPFDKATGTRGFNTNTMQSLGATYASKGGFFEVDVSSSGCKAGANECVHVSLVNAHPHDPSKAMAEADYGMFDAAHPVNTAYLTAKAAEAGLVK